MISRRYHTKVIDEAFHKLKKISRDKALEKVHKEKDQETPLVTKFHPNLPSLSKILKKRWQVMTSEDPRLKRIFPKQSVVAYRRGKNLKDLLVRAKVSAKRKSNRILNGLFKCGRGFFKQCVTCSEIPRNGIKTHKCNKTSEVFHINNNVNCIFENVIYRITCQKPQCKSFVYIGQTKRRFCDRISEHRG